MFEFAKKNYAVLMKKIIDRKMKNQKKKKNRAIENSFVVVDCSL